MDSLRGRTARELRPAEGWAGLLFSLPGMTLLFLFLAVPFALAVFFSFTNQRLISPLPLRFVGGENYVRIFQDADFWNAFGNNVIFVVVVVPIQTGLALFLAILVNTTSRSARVLRTIYFLPVVTVMAVAATVWRLLYSVDTGLINAALRFFSFGALESDWLRSPTMALPAIMIMSVWQGVGFQMIILLAALQDIPQELYEAGSIDGASRWQLFRFITLPQLRNALVFVATVTTILAFRLFDQPWIMTNRGGPLGATETMMVRLVNVGFTEQRIAQGSAIAVVFFVIVLAVTLVQRRFLREEAAA
jgi:multiple sugar transport system permease protein